MTDINKDIRLAVDTGSVAIGSRSLMRSINGGKSKLIVIAAKGKPDIIQDILHACNIAGIKVLKFNGTSVDLGTVCGKPHLVNGLSIEEAGDSNILKEEYA